MEKFKQDEVVFHYGDYGQEFFIIISGKVSVKVPTLIQMNCYFKDLLNFLVENFDYIIWKKIENGDSLKKSAEYEKQARLLQQHKITTIDTPPSEKSKSQTPPPEKIIKHPILDPKLVDEKGQYNIWMLKEVAQLVKGKSFGELALITSKPRAATIFCMEETDLAILDKLSYEKVVGKALKRKIHEKVEFLKQFRILHHIPETHLQRLLYYLQEHRFNRGHVIFKSGQQSDGVYFIRSGEFELVREINIAKQVENFIAKSRQTDMTMGQKLMLKKQTQIKSDPSMNKIRIAILGVGEVFGIEECNQETPLPRKNTVICNKNDSQVYFISFQDFRERIIGEKVLQDIEIENQLKNIFYKFRKAQIKVFGKMEEDSLNSNGNHDQKSEPNTMKIKDFYKAQSQQDYQNIVKHHLQAKGSLRNSITVNQLNEDEEFMNKIKKHQSRLKPLDSSTVTKAQHAYGKESGLGRNNKMVSSAYRQKSRSVGKNLNRITDQQVNQQFQTLNQADEEELRKMKKDISMKSFYKLITESMKTVDKIENNRGFIKVIDAIKLHNDKIFLNKNKISEFDVDIRHLEGTSSTRLRKELKDAKKKQDKSYSPSRIRTIGNLIQNNSDNKQTKTPQVEELHKELIVQKKWSQEELLSKILSHQENKNFTLGNQRKSIQSINAAQLDSNMIILPSATIQPQLYTEASIIDLMPQRLESKIEASEYYNDKVPNTSVKPSYTFRDVDVQKQFLPTNINYSYVQKMKKTNKHNKNHSQGSITIQNQTSKHFLPQDMIQQQQNIKNLFYQYVQNNNQNLIGHQLSQEKIITRNSKSQIKQKQRSHSTINRKEDIVSFRNQLIIKFNNNQMKSQIKSRQMHSQYL